MVSAVTAGSHEAGSLKPAAQRLDGQLLDLDDSTVVMDRLTARSNASMAHPNRTRLKIA